MRGGARRGAGRKRVAIDLEQLEKLSALHCTDQDIAAVLGVSTRTIESRRKEPQFAKAIERGKAKGRISVRRQQMRLVEAGNDSMAIWLGKQLLGQRDVTPLELSVSSAEEKRISMEVVDELIKQQSKKKSKRSSDD
jgi:hypothetical protein